MQPCGCVLLGSGGGYFLLLSPLTDPIEEGGVPKHRVLRLQDPVALVGEHEELRGYLLRLQSGEQLQTLPIRDAEVEFTVDNQTYTINRSFASFVPAGIQHGPLIFRNVKRPIFHFIAADSEKYD